MASAPRDRRPVLLRVKAEGIPERSSHFAGVQFVGKFNGQYSMWCFAAPVGQGGFPDEWFDGWMPLPANENESDHVHTGKR
jgi:hypothetical protein